MLFYAYALIFIYASLHAVVSLTSQTTKVVLLGAPVCRTQMTGGNMKIMAYLAYTIQ